MSLPPMLKMLGLTEETVGEFQSLMKVMLSLPARLDRIERRIDELADAMAPRHIYPAGEGLAGENVCDDEIKLRLATLESVAHQHGLGAGLP